MKLDIGLVMSAFLLVLAVIPRSTDASDTKTSKTSSSVGNSFKTTTFSKDSKPFKSNKVFTSSKPIETSLPSSSSSSTTSETKETFVKTISDSNQSRGRSGSGSGGRGRDYGVSGSYPRTAPASSSYGRKK